MKNEVGDVSHFVGFQADVTDRTRTTRLIRVLNRALRHNVRNDVSAILGWATMLEDGGVSPAEAGGRIVDIATDLADLANRARDLERFATRNRNPERIDPAGTVEAALDHRAEHWPAAALRTTVETDRDVVAGLELERAVLELLDNAIKHHPAEAPEVWLTAQDVGEYVEIAVIDDGWGIEQMEAAVIASGRESDLQHGSGLGLWLVNWIVTRYGGTFEVEQRTDAPGTIARLRIPAVEAGDDDIDSAARPPTVLFA